jgi:anti-sigma B factor antagonist
MWNKGEIAMPETLQPSNSSFTVELADEVDLANAGAIGDALCNALDRTDAGLVVDLSNLTFIDSSGVSMMIRVHKHAESLGKSVSWQGAQPGPMRMFDILALREVVNLAE